MSYVLETNHSRGRVVPQSASVSTSAGVKSDSATAQVGIYARANVWWTVGLPPYSTHTILSVLVIPKLLDTSNATVILYTDL